MVSLTRAQWFEPAPLRLVSPEAVGAAAEVLVRLRRAELFIIEGVTEARPSWDTYFIEIAHLVKTRATCPRRQVGALIVRDKRILCTGYNGAPRGLRHCPVGGPDHDWPTGCMRAGHCIRALHAEQNALLQAAMIGIPCEGASMYVTCQPCNTCAKMIINAGISRVIYEGDYPDDFARDLFRESGMEVFRYKDQRLEIVDLDL